MNQRTWKTPSFSTRTLAPAALLVATLALSSCAPDKVWRDPPLTEEATDCPALGELQPEELDDHPGCNLQGVTVSVGEVGGAVVPATGETVASEAYGADGSVKGFELTNYGIDGVLLTVHGTAGSETWGPKSALERAAEEVSTS
ncbi:hypothetical protein [Cellulosimicrobium sp. NPDC057862]|uniref:hypothetical protein n=1 Tax=Cellulosimicrobium sp. NPDC057862 TaxID=3346266 RepID=UPI00366E1723